MTKVLVSVMPAGSLSGIGTETVKLSERDANAAVAGEEGTKIKTATEHKGIESLAFMTAYR